MNQGQSADPFPLHGPPGTDAKQRSEALKERVYVTFTMLAVTIAYERDAAHATISGAALTLLLTILGTLLAVFIARRNRAYGPGQLTAVPGPNSPMSCM